MDRLRADFSSMDRAAVLFNLFKHFEATKEDSAYRIIFLQVQLFQPKYPAIVDCPSPFIMSPKALLLPIFFFLLVILSNLAGVRPPPINIILSIWQIS